MDGFLKQIMLCTYLANNFCLFSSGKGIVCPGVCVAERIADYCEAVLNVTEMCKTGLRCCVSKDAFTGDEHLVVLDRNSTRISVSNEPHRPPSTTSTTTTAAPPPSAAAAPPPGSKQCRGECVSGLFALFCDDVDADAYCPGEDSSCCVTAPADAAGSGQQQHQHQQPQQSSSPSQRPSAASRPTPAPTTTQAGPPLPKCPGFCLLNLMAAFCERPSVLVSYTSTCKRGSVCCDNTKVAAQSATHSQKPKPRPPAPTTTTTTMPPPPPDGRPECPGSCIVPYLSFTCFSKFTMFLFFYFSIVFRAYLCNTTTTHNNNSLYHNLRSNLFETVYLNFMTFCFYDYYVLEFREIVKTENIIYILLKTNFS